VGDGLYGTQSVEVGKGDWIGHEMRIPYTQETVESEAEKAAWVALVADVLKHNLLATSRSISVFPVSVTRTVS